MHFLLYLPPQHHPVYPTPQGALFQKYVSSLTSELLPVNEQGVHPTDPNLKGSLSKLSMASTGSSGSSKDYAPTTTSTSLQSVGGRRVSPWTSPVYAKTGGSRSRDGSPASLDNLSMDELDTDVVEAEETTL